MYWKLPGELAAGAEWESLTTTCQGGVSDIWGPSFGFEDGFDEGT